MRDLIKIVEAAIDGSAGNETTIIKQAITRLIASIDWSGGDLQSVLWELGYQPEDEYVNVNSKEFKKKLKQWAINKCEETLWDLRHKFHGDKIKVWRVITAPKDWKPDPNRHPGIYWSWDKDAARAHWGSYAPGEVEWILSAEVSKQDIDWVQTIAANSHPTNGEDEAEITLKSDVHVDFKYEQLK